jgi:hypothetical protein
MTAPGDAARYPDGAGSCARAVETGRENPRRDSEATTISEGADTSPIA